MFPLQFNLDSCTSLDQERTTILLQTEVGTDDAEKEITNAQAAVCEEFARPPKNRQQRRVTASDSEQTKQFDPGRCWSTPFLFSSTSVCLFCSSLFVFLRFSVFLSAGFPRFQTGTSDEKNLPSSIGTFGKRERDG